MVTLNVTWMLGSYVEVAVIFAVPAVPVGFNEVLLVWTLTTDSLSLTSVYPLYFEDV